MNAEKLSEAAAAAKKVQEVTGFPASVTLAQWALESGWGEHSPGNNCFGIKQYGGCFGTQLLDTTEWLTDLELERFLREGDGHEAILVQPVATVPGPNGGVRKKYACRARFATFPTLYDCFVYRTNMLTKSRRYQGAFKEYQADQSIPRLLDGIAKAGYATDPKYAAELHDIATGERVAAALA